jgi:hypothetical protein
MVARQAFQMLKGYEWLPGGPKNAPRNHLGAPEEGSFGTFRQLDDVVINNGQTA